VSNNEQISKPRGHGLKEDYLRGALRSITLLLPIGHDRVTRMYHFPPGAHLAMIGADRRRCPCTTSPRTPSSTPHRRFAVSQRCAAVRHPQSPGRSTLHCRVGFRHPQ